MAKAENDQLLGPLLRRSALAGQERARRAARRAEREFFASEEQDSVISIARVLGEIDSAENRAGLETRMQQLEEQVERLTTRPDESYQAIESKIHLLRTTIESALEAIEAPPAAAVPDALILAEDRASAPLPSDVADGLREEFEDKLLEARSDLRFEILEVQKQVEVARVTPPAEFDIDEFREEFVDRLNASEERTLKSTADLEEMIRAQRERLDQLQVQQLELMERLSMEMASFARTLAVKED